MALAGKWELMQAIATLLRDAFVAELEDGHAIQVERGYVAIPTTELACVDVFPAPTARGTDTAGFGDLFGEYLLTIRVRTSSADELATQEVLVALSDDTNALSIPAILDTDPTLGGLATSVYLQDESGWRTYLPGDLPGFEWTVAVVPADS